MTGPPLRALSRTGVSVPILGFGVSGPLGLPLVSDQAVSALVEAMIEGGAALFDTAPFYHAAQPRLGRALGRSPDAVVATKVGTVRAASGRLAKDYSPGGILAQVEGSRRALGRDRLDLVQLHGAPRDVVADPSVRRVFEGLKAHGVIRLTGATLRTAEELSACLEADWIDVIQAPLSPGPAPDWPQRAAEAGKGVLVVEAMRAAAGPRPVRAPADLWYLARRWRQGRLAAAPAVTAAEALRAALTQPGVTAVLTTSTRLAHVRANLAVAASIPA